MTGTKTKPHYTGHRDRLRQRFLNAGPDGLADYELLELLLFGAIPRRDVKPLAKQLLTEFGGFAGVLAADPAQLEQRGSLGPSAIVALKAVQAAAERMLRQQVAERPVLGGWEQLMAYLRLAMQDQSTEQVRLLFLDKKNALIADEVMQQGTVEGRHRDDASDRLGAVVRRCGHPRPCHHRPRGAGQFSRVRVAVRVSCSLDRAS